MTDNMYKGGYMAWRIQSERSCEKSYVIAAPEVTGCGHGSSDVVPVAGGAGLS